MRTYDLLLVAGLVGLVPLGVVAYRLGRDPGYRSTTAWVLAGVGLLAGLAIGVLPAALVAAGMYLVGKGTVSQGAGKVLLPLVGVGLMGFPLMIGGLIFLAGISSS